MKFGGQKKMNISASSENIFSHPNKLLVSHLLETRDEALKYIDNLSIDFNLSKNILKKTIEIITLTHDLGKATIFFQEYLKASEKEDYSTVRKLKQNKLHTHSLLSAVYTFSALYKLIRDKSYVNNLKIEQEKRLSLWLPYIGFLCVKRHHGDLGNIEDEFLITRRQHERLVKQNKNLHSGFNQILKRISGEIGIEISVEEVNERFDTILDKIDEFQDLFFYSSKKTKSAEFYFISLFFFSLLTDADKTNAMGLDKPVLDKIEGNIVDNYRNNRFPSINEKEDTINYIRNSIYKEVLENIKSIDTDTKLFTLTAPTGSGKTLTVLSAAIRLSEKIRKEKGFEPKIIYCLPFLSIIDQNAIVIKRLLKYKRVDSEKYQKLRGKEIDLSLDTKDFTIKSSEFLINHHLSDVFYKTEEEEYDKNQSQFLIEDWHSRVVITTFVQLFHSLFSNRNKAIRKTHNIYNSIIILDEIQAIPHKYWEVIRRVIKEFVNKTNVYVILATATQPWLFKKEDNIKELVSNKEEYFQKLNRTHIKLYLEKIKMSDFLLDINCLINNSKDSSLLFVMNTIYQAIQVYQAIKETSPNVQSIFLSTKILPKIREERLKEIKQKLDCGEKVIIVSTQLVEAGVDIDVDILVRDFAPLDSINQASGRCNRNNSEKKGQVIIYNIVDDRKAESKTTFSSYIYDSFLLFKTKQILEKKGNLDENEFFELVDEYFQSIARDGDEMESEQLLQSIQKGFFEDVGKFQLINKKMQELPVFLDADDESSKLWKEYMKIWEIKDWKKRNEAFLNIKNKMYRNTINISSDFAKKLEEFKGFHYIPSREVKNYYDEEIGFFKSKGGPFFVSDE